MQVQILDNTLLSIEFLWGAVRDSSLVSARPDEVPRALGELLPEPSEVFSHVAAMPIPGEQPKPVGDKKR